MAWQFLGGGGGGVIVLGMIDWICLGNTDQYLPIYLSLPQKWQRANFGATK